MSLKKKEKKNAQFLFNVIKSVASVYEGNKAMEKKKKKKVWSISNRNKLEEAAGHFLPQEKMTE